MLFFLRFHQGETTCFPLASWCTGFPRRSWSSLSSVASSDWPNWLSRPEKTRTAWSLGYPKALFSDKHKYQNTEKDVVTPLRKNTDRTFFLILHVFTVCFCIFVAWISRLLWEIFGPWILFWYHTYTKVEYNMAFSTAGFSIVGTDGKEAERQVVLK